MNFLDLKKWMNLPYLASEHGGKVDSLIVYVHYLMIALFIGWIIYFGYVLFRFREKKNPKADHVGIQGHASTYLEVIVAGIEGVLLFGLAVPLWREVVDKMPDPKNSTVMRVYASQFDWVARYPGPDGTFGKQDMTFITSDNPYGVDPADPNGKDDSTSPSKLIQVPVNKPVIAYITSKDVIHSFKILPMRVTQDATPGIVVPVWFVPKVAGKYTINCAQLCGTGHYGMRGQFNVVSQEDFDKWVNGLSKGSSAGGGLE